MHFPYRYIKIMVSISISDLPRRRVSEEQSRSLSLFLHGWGYSDIVPICSHRRNRRKAVASMPLGKSNGQEVY